MSLIASTDADVVARAAQVRLACFDVDGTLTDGRLLFDAAGNESKAFHVHDGQGLVLLRLAGIVVALVTARSSRVVTQRAAELGIAAHLGVRDKHACVEGICRQLNLDWAAVACFGDDLPDLPVMRVAGLAGAPADAHPDTARHAHWRSTRPGGHGAAREFCDLLLAAQGHDAEALLAAARRA
jgi:3-deoxy-D-manno-octulosonate 8-phosphate phosphatase (KDO 8-P phosphatase)